MIQFGLVDSTEDFLLILKVLDFGLLLLTFVFLPEIFQ